MRQIGHWVAAAVGGGLGSLARYLLQGWVQRRAGEAHGWAAVFPWGTLAVNLSGCLLIGFLAMFFEQRLVVAPETRTFVLIGLLGGFTTFSSFGFETFALLRDGNTLLALANVAASVTVGLVAVVAGAVLARAL